MNKLIVISGFSGAGKDKISQWISDNLNYKFVILDTSRPMRINEFENKPYHFITKNEFEQGIKNNDYIEYRQYNTLVNNISDLWYYGTNKNSIDLTKNNYIIVQSVDGFLKLKEYFKDQIISFFINVNEQTRKERSINRKSFDLTEWNRRTKDENESFPIDFIKKEFDYVIENYDFNKCVNEISKILKGDWVSTYTGTKFYVLDPKPEEILIEDIAHALSMICRYRGHCKFFYSVAQHSIGVQKILKQWGCSELIQLYGLLHDATEAYICDIPRPIKNNIPNYKTMESELEVKILKSFNLPKPTLEISNIVKEADNAMLKCETKILMSNWQEWDLPYKDVNIKIEERSINKVKQDFLLRVSYYYLMSIANQ